MRVGKLASGFARMRHGGAWLLSNPRHRLGVCATVSLALALSGLYATPSAAQSAPGEPLQMGPAQVMAGTSGHLDLGAGVYDIIGDHHRDETGAADAEYRFGQKFYYIGPALGVIGDARGGGMAYAAFYSDIALGPVVVTPLAGLGAWWHGAHNDENLGGTFEFRLSLEAAYRWDNGSRLGLRFGHISSADIHLVNPGENDLMLTYAFPLTF
ncbi:MAG: acyloxyacyl hydrolase [Stellaceae bacterium]